MTLLDRLVFPVLESAKEIPLHELTLPVSEVRTFPAISAEELIRSGRSCSETRAKIAFLSPCAFKQSGRYTIFPQETLLLQSLIAHLERCLFQNMPLSILMHYRLYSKGFILWIIISIPHVIC